MAEKRPNFLVRAARRVKGAFSDTRRNPETGVKQVRLGMRGGWADAQATSRAHPKPQGKATNYLSAPRGIATPVARRSSAPIGMGRIGTGEGIGTSRGTASASWKGGKTWVGEAGIIGFSRIGGMTRGSAASPAGASGSNSPGI